MTRFCPFCKETLDPNTIRVASHLRNHIEFKDAVRLAKALHLDFSTQTVYLKPGSTLTVSVEASND